MVFKRPITTFGVRAGLECGGVANRGRARGVTQGGGQHGAAVRRQIPAPGSAS